MRRLFVCTAALALWCSPAAAQTRVFVTGGLFGELKASSTNASDAFDEDDTSLGGGGRIGGFLGERWSIELGIDVGGETSRTRIYENIFPVSTELEGLYPGIFPVIPSFQFAETNQITTVSVLLGYHPPTTGRWHPGFAGGLSFVRERRESGLGGIPVPLDFYAPNVLDSVRHGPAATVAFELAIDLTPRLAVVPDVRAHTFDATTVIRPGVAVRWELR